MYAAGGEVAPGLPPAWFDKIAACEGVPDVRSPAPGA
jgi:hypothetical protein